jgi:hypothetical protein
MEKIDIQNFKKYYFNDDGNATLARVGHVNAVIQELNETIENIDSKITKPETLVTGGSVIWNGTEFICQVQGGAIPVLTVYPTTTSAEAGNQFWYKGNLWHYMTQAEIDSTGWTGLVTVGFPAPVSKNSNPSIAGFFAASLSNFSISDKTEPNTIIDFLGWSNPNKADRFAISGNSNIIGFRNAMLLVSLKDQGTATAFFAPSLGMSASSINDLFTQLPLTTNVATITVTGNPGAATCDPTIATGKGYIVIT